MLTRWESRVGGGRGRRLAAIRQRRREADLATQRHGDSMGGRADNEPAGSYLWVAMRWDLQGEVLSLLCRCPPGSRGGGGLVLVTASTLLLSQSCQGSRGTESRCSGAEGSLLGAASDVTGHEQRRREVCMGLTDTSPEAGQTTASDPLCPSMGSHQSLFCVQLPA